MNIQELEAYVEHEIKWLTYYIHKDARNRVMTEDVNPYTDLKPMGYVKRMMSLEDRCVPCFFTADGGIKEGMDLNLLQRVGPPREEGKLTPFETLSIIYPERRIEFLKKLEFGDNNSKVHKLGES